jgi:hypothetical protein
MASLERVASAFFSQEDIAAGEAEYEAFMSEREFSESDQSEDDGERQRRHSASPHSRLKGAWRDRDTSIIGPGSPVETVTVRQFGSVRSDSTGAIGGTPDRSVSESRGRSGTPSRSFGVSPSDAEEYDLTDAEVEVSRVEEAEHLAEKEALVESWRRAAFERWQKGSSGGTNEAIRVGAHFGGRGFAIAAGTKVALAILFGLVRRPGRREGETPVGGISGLVQRVVAAAPEVFKDSARFALTTFVMLGMFRGLLAWLRQRRRRKYEQVRATREVTAEDQRGRIPPGPVTTVDDVNDILRGDLHDKIIAGTLAGAGLALDVKDRRQMISLYLFVRALDVLRNTLERKGVLPVFRHTDSVLFGIANIPIMYGFLRDPTILPKSYYGWILWMGNLKDAEMEHMIRVNARDPTQPLQSCQGILYQTSAVTGILRDWIEGLGRASRVYAPVHLLPLVLFKFANLRENPQSTLIKAGLSMFSSMMFLTTYQSIVKASQIVLHEGRLGNTPGPADWKFITSGALTGVACLFEKPHRVNELMLYCVPRAFEATYTLLERRGRAGYVPFGEVLIFMLTTGIILSQDQSDFKPTYGRLVRWVVGEY